jgi:hypothetical protein
LSTPADKIEALIDQLDRECKSLKHEVLKSVWFMRGGVSYDDAMMLPYEDRKIIADIVKANLETTKETKLPFF